MVDVLIDRSMWTHSFSLADGDFEIHEGLSIFAFRVRRPSNPAQVIAESTASGLFEFGGNLVGVNDDE